MCLPLRWPAASKPETRLRSRFSGTGSVRSVPCRCSTSARRSRGGWRRWCSACSNWRATFATTWTARRESPPTRPRKSLRRAGRHIHGGLRPSQVRSSPRASQERYEVPCKRMRGEHRTTGRGACWRSASKWSTGASRRAGGCLRRQRKAIECHLHLFFHYKPFLWDRVHDSSHSRSRSFDWTSAAATWTSSSLAAASLTGAVLTVS